MKIKNIGTPLDKPFELVEVGEGYVFDNMFFIKTPEIKQYRKDIPELKDVPPEEYELPGGKDYIIRNAVQLDTGLFWNFDDKDVVMCPPFEVVVGVPLPKNEEEEKEAMETLVKLPPKEAVALPTDLGQELPNGAGVILSPEQAEELFKQSVSENPEVSPEAAQDFMNKPIEKGE